MNSRVWGNVVDALGNSVPDAFCFKKGANIGVKIIWSPGEIPKPWAISAVHLWDTYDNNELWNELNCSTRHGWHTANSIHWFVDDPDTWPIWAGNNLPNHICHLRLDGDIIFANQTERFTRNSDLYVVLDAPKAPMNPAWEGVLFFASQIAHGDSGSFITAIHMASVLWEISLWQSLAMFATIDPSNKDAPDTLWLKEFLEAWNGKFHGNCADLADFLVCLNTSVGGLPAKAQRTKSLYQTFGLWTNKIDPAGIDFGPDWYSFDYHQFVLTNTPLMQNLVWDGCITFVAPTVPT